MRRYDSARGARRGLALAVAGVLLWTVWAATYLHAAPAGATPSPAAASQACECGHLRGI